MKKKKVHAFVSTLLFLLLGIFLYAAACRFLESPAGDAWASGTGMIEARRHKNKYDVVFAGTSTTIANISCQELFKEYGIASVCVGEPGQPAFLTKYTLQDLFRYQKPKVVVLDTKSLFYGL